MHMFVYMFDSNIQMSDNLFWAHKLHTYILIIYIYFVPSHIWTYGKSNVGINTMRVWKSNFDFQLPGEVTIYFL